MRQQLQRWLAHPLLRDHPLGSPEWFAAQRRMVEEKPIIHRCYLAWYHALLSDAASVPTKAAIVELGSGSSFLKQLHPELIATDVVPGEVDLVADGTHLPFQDHSVQALLLTHVFHHIPDVAAFLHEAERVLVPGGVISMVDCAHTPFSRFFFGSLHPEPYRADAAEWSFPPGHTMLDSNQALTWIVFERDRQRFESEFPALHIEARRWLPWFSYLGSGGVNLRSFLPQGWTGFADFADRSLHPLDPLFAIHWHWTIRRR